MQKHLQITITVLLLFMLSALSAAETGSFYKVTNTSGVRTARGLASVIAIPRTTFKYTPGKTKNGVMDDLTLTAYAIAQDNSVLALAESAAQQDGTFINRLIFLENGSFRIINGTEYKEVQ